jgi:hypothetical protein
MGIKAIRRPTDQKTLSLNLILSITYNELSRTRRNLRKEASHLSRSFPHLYLANNFLPFNSWTTFVSIDWNQRTYFELFRYHQVVLHRKNIRHLASAQIRQIFVRLVIHRAFQRNVPIFHDNVNRWHRLLGVAR